MKKFLPIIFGILFTLPLLTNDVRAFNDINNHAYRDSIINLKDLNVVEGYADGTFRPFDKINRAEFIKIVVGAKLGKEPTSYASRCFSDITRNAWFEKWVCYAKNNGIVSGYADGKFLPEAKINIVEAAKIVTNVFDVPLAEVDTGAQWYEPYLGGLQAKNYIPSDLKNESQLINRGEMAELINRIILNITNKPSSNFVIKTSSSNPVQPIPIEPDNDIEDELEPIPIESNSEDLVLDGFFPIGVFAQPQENFTQWADRGLNSLYEYPQGTDTVSWDIAAEAAGLYRYRRPTGNAARDNSTGWTLANIDEPDILGNDWACGGGEGACTQVAINLSNQWDVSFPDKDQWINLAGPNIWLSDSCDYCNGPGDGAPNNSCYPQNDQCYPSLINTNTKFVCLDIYPIGGWLPYETDRNRVALVGDVLDKLRGWLNEGQETCAIIETSDQRLGFDGAGTRGPTPGEVRAMIWNSINHGARAIHYFSTAFNPFQYDGTTPAVSAEITTQNAIITALAPVLQGEINPDAISISAGSNIDIGWRISGGIAYIIAVNTSSNPISASINLNNVNANTASVYNASRTLSIVNNVISDDFEAHGVNIYMIQL